MSSKVSHPVDGFLLIDKPLGVRSTDCVSAVKRALGRGYKVGHAGTLDSTARGLLVVLIGRATRLCRYVMDLPKTYEGKVVLGVTTLTDDDSGEILAENAISSVDRETLDRLMPSFLGIRMQCPPSISAIRVDGKRAHSICRENRVSVRLPARPVFISQISVGDIDDGCRQIPVKVACHKGTYIRSIARDIGEMLGFGAHLKDLLRRSIGPFEHDKGIKIGDSLSFDREDLLSSIVPMESLSDFYATYALSDYAVDRLGKGLEVPVAGLEVISRGSMGGGKSVIALGKGLFSFCRLKTADGRGVLVPETNLFLGGGEFQ